jgi:N-acetylmuramoyl-L-alanine amidase
MPSGDLALARLRDPASAVSCHYLVWEDGRVTQIVAEERRAWHAGHSFWAGERDMNTVSIGIEIVNPGHDGGAPPYPAAQIDAVIALCGDIIARHAIPRERVLAHSDIAPDRKIDPGEYFPWDRLAAAGIGLWAPPAPITTGPVLCLGDQGPDVMTLQRAFAALGYDAPSDGRFDATTRLVVEAFQRHFRPARVDGEADVSTRETLRLILAGVGLP